MPVAHGYETVRVDTLAAQFNLESPSLLLGVATDRRASANRRVVMLDFAGPGRRDQLCKRFAADSRKWEVDDIRIAKQVVKKRLNRLQSVRPAKLEENYPYTPVCPRHRTPEPFPTFLRTHVRYSQSSVGVNGGIAKLSARKKAPIAKSSEIRAI